MPDFNPTSIVIGLTGPNASGKGEAAKLLVSQGFAAHSLSDVVREEATAAGMEHSRDNLIAVGVRLRSEGGPGVLARRILPRLSGRDVVDSIRHPGEVEVLRTMPRFILLGLDAPLSLRFERSISRGRLGDGASLQEFSRKETRENSSSEAGQQLENTLRLADRCITNDGSIEDLAARLAAALSDLGMASDG